MRIAKPMLAVTTPLGVAWGVLEAWRFHWWLAVLMAALVAVIGAFFWLTVRRIRLEREAASAAGEGAPGGAALSDRAPPPGSRAAAPPTRAAHAPPPHD